MEFMKSRSSHHPKSQKEEQLSINYLSQNSDSADENTEQSTNNALKRVHSVSLSQSQPQTTKRAKLAQTQKPDFEGFL